MVHGGLIGKAVVLAVWKSLHVDEPLLGGLPVPCLGILLVDWVFSLVSVRYEVGDVFVLLVLHFSFYLFLQVLATRLGYAYSVSHLERGASKVEARIMPIAERPKMGIPDRHDSNRMMEKAYNSIM